MRMMLLLFTMEIINKITLNGVDYAITDKQAQALITLLSDSIKQMDGEQKEIGKRIDNIEDTLEWKKF